MMSVSIFRAEPVPELEPEPDPESYRLSGVGDGLYGLVGRSIWLGLLLVAFVVVVALGLDLDLDLVFAFVLVSNFMVLFGV